MAVLPPNRLSELPPELILHIVSFLTRLAILDADPRLPEPVHYFGPQRTQTLPQLLPDLPSINAFSQTNTTFHNVLDQTLYGICASVERLGKLALLFAVQHELENTIDKLVAAGISLDCEFIVQSDYCGLLQIAAGMGSRAMVVKLLGMYGSEMTTKAHTRHGLFTNATALDRAAKYGHKEVVRLLAPIPLPAISIPNRVAIASFLPLNLPPVLSGFETRRQYLSLALMESAKAGNIEICEYLISEGADVNFLEEICIAPPLYFAVQADNLAVVQLLLAAGAQPNLHNECIPLFGALRTRNFDVVQALVDGGADIHVRGNQSQNVLSTCPTLELLRFFLERGVNPNSEDTAGETPLHRACRRKNAEFAKASVELFLQFGATVETVSLATRTPVHVAMEARHPEIVKILQPLVQGPDLKLEIEDWWNLWEQTHQSY